MTHDLQLHSGWLHNKMSIFGKYEYYFVFVDGIAFNSRSTVKGT